MLEIGTEPAPVTRAPGDGAGSRKTRPAKSDKRLNILMVEDDKADAYLIETALLSNPLVGEIVHARDGVEALKVVDARTFKPDLALVDLQMPSKNGLSLLLELRNRVLVEFPAVVLSSSRSGADRVRARVRGADTFITKPNNLKKMTETLDAVIADISHRTLHL
jgi:CheY-like chemotaxis protein